MRTEDPTGSSCTAAIRHRQSLRTGLDEMSRRFLQLAGRLEGGDAFGIIVGNVRAGADLRLGLRKQLPISAVA